MGQHAEEKLDTKTTADFIAERLKDPTNGEAYYRAYLRAGFLESAVNTLYEARRQAGLTQAQVAEKLNTGQAMIARLEDDTKGAMSLHRYVDFMMACGMIPYNITYVPVEAVRSYTVENPQWPLTQENYHTWLLNTQFHSMLGSQNVLLATVSNQPSITFTTTVQSVWPPAMNIVEPHKQTPLPFIVEENKSIGVTAPYARAS
jgi:transcriptional regulator with XRE-family HTH domain